MAVRWNAERAHMRAPLNYEHMGLSALEAVSRIIALNAAVHVTGISKHVPAHIAQLAPCLHSLPVPPHD